MSRSALSKLFVASSILASLALVSSAGAQSASPPNFWIGEAGWVHNLNATFPPVQGSPSPVVQDPGHPFGQNSWRIGDLSNPNLKPWVKEVMKKDSDEIDRGKIAFQARSSCLPSGVPNIFLPGNPLWIVQTPKEVWMIKQGGVEIRRIYLDVPHSKNLKPSWYGESVGHYEGNDTLVVDTIGMNDKSFVDNFRTPHTEKLHVVERFKLVDGGKALEVSVWFEDADAFYEPWSVLQRYDRVQRPMREEICAEGNRHLFDYIMPIAEKPDF